MRDRHEETGAVFGSAFGAEVVRHYGSPAEEYRAATEGAAVVDRSHRTRIRLAGRAPLQVVQGVLSGTIPDPPADCDGLLCGRWEYSLVLTPKGRIVSDLRITRSPSTDEEEFIVDVPAAGAGALGEHFGRFVPPRMATTETLSEETGMLSVMGPMASRLLCADPLDEACDAGVLDEMEEGDALWVEEGGTLGTQIVRGGDLATPQFDVFADGDRIRALWASLVDGGARPVGRGVVHTLRIEAGRPAFGVDMSEETIPYEAGIVERAVDHRKGCYTGQEVIVRIRDRGHVNRHLRGLKLGEGASPPPGTELLGSEGEKPLGSITSVADSPRAGETIALGYVRREVEPPAELHLAEPGGRSVSVRELTPGWYA